MEPETSLPVIRSVSPIVARRNTVLRIVGSGFRDSSVVSASGTKLPTKYISGEILEAKFNLSANQGWINIIVMNPQPYGGASNAAGIRVG